MGNYQMHEVPYKMARRAFRKLCALHSAEIDEEHAFMDADASIAAACGDPLPLDSEPLFGGTSCSIEDKLLIIVADNFGLNPGLLDDAIIATDMRQVRLEADEWRRSEQVFASTTPLF